MYNFISLFVAVESGLTGAIGKIGFSGTSGNCKIKLGISILSSSNLFWGLAYFLILLIAIFWLLLFSVSPYKLTIVGLKNVVTIASFSCAWFLIQQNEIRRTMNFLIIIFF